MNPKPRNPYWRESINTFNLLVLTSPDKLLFIQIFFNFTKGILTRRFIVLTIPFIKSSLPKPFFGATRKTFFPQFSPDAERWLDSNTRPWYFIKYLQYLIFSYSFLFLISNQSIYMNPKPRNPNWRESISTTDLLVLISLDKLLLYWILFKIYKRYLNKEVYRTDHPIQ